MLSGSLLPIKTRFSEIYNLVSTLHYFQLSGALTVENGLLSIGYSFPSLIVQGTI